ncbi:hypothetical protein NKR23_g12140 [Pleurostoma richardsiae]|uniref:Uncharacterized protein n=1 Tax=Pleurostoma richardsiae TaxID=41990 RepID=A0AA38R2N0_9PEZI|nr:hypothetical protein NKR23_g12140 [Pleurostoma richardsiae]
MRPLLCLLMVFDLAACLSACSVPYVSLLLAGPQSARTLDVPVFSDCGYLEEAGPVTSSGNVTALSFDVLYFVDSDGLSLDTANLTQSLSHELGTQIDADILLHLVLCTASSADGRSFPFTANSTVDFGGASILLTNYSCFVSLPYTQRQSATICGVSTTSSTAGGASTSDSVSSSTVLSSPTSSTTPTSLAGGCNKRRT